MELPLTADAFEKQPRGPFFFDWWRTKTPLVTRVGEFHAELREPPDDELLALVNELMTFVRDQNEEILDKIHEHYLLTFERGGEAWLRGCGVKAGLSRDRIVRHLKSRTVAVRRNKKRQLRGTIVISPAWDVEHQINLHLVNGSLCFETL